jgi:hypothetical protein
MGVGIRRELRGSGGLEEGVNETGLENGIQNRTNACIPASSVTDQLHGGLRNSGSCTGGCVEAAKEILDGSIEARRDVIQQAGQNLCLIEGNYW